MGKIKIVHVIGALGRGGAERFVVDLCNEMANQEQYELYLVSLCGNKASTSFMEEINPSVNYLSFDKPSGLSLKVLLKLTSWLIRQKPAIVHSHLNALEYLLLYRIRNRHARFFHTIHSTAEAECPNLLVRALRKFLYKQQHIVPIAVSDNGGESFRQCYGLRHITVIENGRPYLNLTAQASVLNEIYKRRNDAFLLLHVGRIVSVKNQRLLIEAVQKFNAIEQQKCRLILIGDVRDKSLYQELHALADSDGYIEFVGGKTNIADYLSIADFFCLSSFHEGMPISLIEALSLGCIPIVTNVGGIKNMIRNEVNGFVSPDCSVEAYYQTLKKAVFYPDKPRIIANSYHSFEHNYHIGASGKKHLEAYHTL